MHVGADAAAEELSWLNRVRDYGEWMTTTCIKISATSTLV